jgi:dolichol-phosphate mannosyltransferase
MPPKYNQYIDRHRKPRNPKFAGNKSSCFILRIPAIFATHLVHCFFTLIPKSDRMQPLADVTVILPTLNEAKNIRALLTELCTIYDPYIIVADDGSTDGTREIVKSLASSRLRLIDRSDENTKGLTASVLHAIAQVQTPYFIVMDADGQHPSSPLPLIARYLIQQSDLVVACRYEVEAEWSIDRRLLSWAGSFFGKISLLLRGKNYLSYDILSGYFGARTNSWHNLIADPTTKKRFQPKGYKVLFDFLKIAPHRLVSDKIPYRFETRKADQSKIDLRIYAYYFKSLFLF